MVADAELLGDLRERVLDEAEPLAGLLRTCLALGAVTGSKQLRLWAAQELKGYQKTAEVPAYRKLLLPLAADTISPFGEVILGQSLPRPMIPAEGERLIPERLPILLPIEHLAGMAGAGDEHKVEHPNCAYVASMWNQQRSEDNPRISQLYYKLPSTALLGVLSIVRTTLVEMVMDMAKDVPLHQLPSRKQADAAVHVHVNGSQYNVNVDTNAGIIGQGTHASQTQTGVPDHTATPPATHV
ncbi:hypothetical protein [Nocardia cyriacigeorgica]|uniref:AbiTii domain-containing protein n=1 Tax=Nocardia cyriacigeorgica TaxID=135487 RepID=UPI0011D1B453|nr:hypothetical protein [Nocardia cyriacigeorgica]